jgi:hypothetical protein
MFDVLEQAGLSPQDSGCPGLRARTAGEIAQCSWITGIERGNDDWGHRGL